MAKRDPRLTLRGSTWYCRVKVPDALRAAGLIKVREFKKSLGTSDFAEARRLLPLELVKIDAEISSARRKLSAKPVHTLSRSEAEHLAVQLFHSREAKRVAHKPAGSERDAWKRLTPEKAKDARIGHAEMDADLADWFEALKDPDNDEARNVINNAARGMLVNHGVDLDTSSPEWRDFLMLVRRVYVEEARRTLREHRQDYSTVPSDALFEGVDTAKPLPPKIAPDTLSDLLTRFRNEPDQRALSPKSKGSNAARDRLFKEILGAETPVTAITRPDVARFVELLSRLPPNATKKWPKLSGVEAAAKAVEHGLEPMTRLTAKSYLGNLHTIFDFAVKRGLRDSNPVAGLSVGSDGIAAKDRRRSFNDDQLKKIFAAPLYVGCQDDQHGYDKPGTGKPRRGRFWVPLLCLFHGIRLNEACQLHVADVTDLDGVPVNVVKRANNVLARSTRRWSFDSGVNSGKTRTSVHLNRRIVE